MAVLDTFFLLFDADTDPLEKGAKKATKITDKLEDNLKDADAKTKVVGKSFSSLITKAGAALAGVFAVSKLATSVFNASQNAADLELMSAAIGESAADIDAWGAAVTEAGGDANTFMSTLEGFNQKVQELSLVLENDLSPVMRELGVDFLDSAGKGRKVLDILPELAASFQGISKQKALGLGQKLGLDRGTIMLLMRGRKEIETIIDRQRQINTIDDDYLATSAEMRIALNDARRAWTAIAQALGKLVLPAITKVLDGFTSLISFMQRHETFAKTFFGVLATGAVIMTGAFIPAIWSAATAVWALIAPIILIPALIAAAAIGIGLFVDDVVTFLEGGESAIGNFLEYLKSIPKAYYNEVIKPVMEMGAKFAKFLGFDASVASELNVASGAIAGAANNPLGAQTSTSIMATNSATNRNNSVTTGDIIVNTQATDADGTAKALNDTLREQMFQASDDFDDGVAG